MPALLGVPDEVEANGLLSTIGNHSNSVNIVRWSRDGQYLASGSDDSYVLVYRLATGAAAAMGGSSTFGRSAEASKEPWQRCLSLHGHSADVLDLSWSSRCLCLCLCLSMSVSVSICLCVCVYLSLCLFLSVSVSVSVLMNYFVCYHTKTYTNTPIPPPRPHTATTAATTTTTTTRGLLASSSIDNSILLWTVFEATQRGSSVLAPLRVLSGHVSFVKGLSFDPIGELS